MCSLCSGMVEGTAMAHKDSRANTSESRTSQQDDAMVLEKIPFGPAASTVEEFKAAMRQVGRKIDHKIISKHQVGKTGFIGWC